MVEYEEVANRVDDLSNELRSIAFLLDTVVEKYSDYNSEFLHIGYLADRVEEISANLRKLIQEE